MEIQLSHFTNLLQEATYNTLHTLAAFSKTVMQQRVELASREYDLVVALGPTKNNSLLFRMRTRVCVLPNVFVPTYGEQFFTHR